MANYDPVSFKALTFHDHVPAFLAGTDTPRAYLDRCIATIEAREPTVKAWASLRIDAARTEADASTLRYAAGNPLSPIDGMPLGVKDLIQTRDLPNTLGVIGHVPAPTGHDAASIWALEAAGAIILGKVTSTELGGTWPSESLNPFDSARTPGGSSSGSGAAVGAGMVPAALGTQVGGSIIRPASFCANFAIKPTIGALHRGDRLGLSQACLGVHAGSLVDMWQVAIEIANRAGGDPGHPGLYCGALPPEPMKPVRLIVMEGEGWPIADATTLAAFEQFVSALQASGVEILRKGDSPAIDAFEAAIMRSRYITGMTVGYENRWSYTNLFRTMPEKLSPVLRRQHEAALDISLADYRAAIAERDIARKRLADLAHVADALIAPSAIGVAPLIVDPESVFMPTGDATFNTSTSMLGGPALTLPIASVGGLPLGFQLVGQWHDDEKLCAMGRWIMDAIPPISVAA